MKKLLSSLMLAGGLLAATVQPAYSADHTVQAVGVKFEPMFMIIEPGDTVNFEGMSGHLIETINEMIPEGQEPVLTEMGANVGVKFDVEGVVAYKCTPHWGARMGGIILVGNPEDPSAIIEDYLAGIEAAPVNKPAKGLLKKFRKFLTEQDKI